MKYSSSNFKSLTKVCSNCNSKSIIKWGLRHTQNRGKIQRYKCNDCGNTFVEDNGFFRMRNSPQKITLCLDLFYRGISTRKVQEHLQAFYPHNSSNVSIYKWIVKYSKHISLFTENLKLKVGKELQIDEMQFNRRRQRNKKGVERNWFIDTIDTETRFMVASQFNHHRDMKEVITVLKSAKKKTEKQIQFVTSDGWTAYPKAIKKTFGYNNKLGKHNVQHHQVNASKGEGFNIKIERLHNSVRHRVKTFRGFHGSIESANAILKGWEIYYNFIRKHMALGVTPSELATDLRLENPNKWLELITLSS